MKMNLFARSWISPFVTVAFGVIGVTGVLLFFHVKNGVIVTLHDWFGWGFVAGGAIHLLLNWRLLVSYLKRRSALVALVLSGVMLVWLSAAGASKQQRGGGGRPVSAVAVALDANSDGTLDAGELSNAGTTLLRLDKNGDGQLTPDEMQARGGGRPQHWTNHRMLWSKVRRLCKVGGSRPAWAGLC